MLLLGRNLTLLVLAAIALLFFSSNFYGKSRPSRPSSGTSFDWEWPDYYHEGEAHDPSQTSPQSSDVKEPPPPKKVHPVAYGDTVAPAASPRKSSGFAQNDQKQKHISIDEYMDAVLKWDRPSKDNHWPPYRDYINKDYDPNRWEGFQRDYGFYRNTGTRFFDKSHSAFERLYTPYPDYDSQDHRGKYNGDFVPCVGARGVLLNQSDADFIRVYDAIPNGFPEPFAGSYEAIGLHSGMCMDRAQRYGPYGLNQLLSNPSGYVDWNNVNWGTLQRKCMEKNKNRFTPMNRHDWNDISLPLDQRVSSSEMKSRRDTTTPASEESTRAKIYQARTAILIRTWEGYDYTENDIFAIRAMITELSLQTGGQYQVFLMVNIKDRSEPIHTDHRAYQKMMWRTVPKELHDVAILWSEEICEHIYPDVGDWQVYWQQWMPVQWFSETHPEFDYVLNWEMDVRYIGNHYHFLEHLGEFSQQQPRKYLWERNARFYLPSFHGNDFETYRNDTNHIIEDAERSGNLETVWGPKPYSIHQKPLGPSPPHSLEEDHFEWGVGEDADFITLLPIWDPVNTKWTMTNKIWNFTPGIRPHFSNDNPTDDDFNHPSLQGIPRRGFINTVTRLSRSLLHTMHVESLAGRSMQAEMWPSTVALHHGFKAVYAPHPIWNERKWPARYADAVFNADGGQPGRWSQEHDSIYNQDREVNFRSWSWYYHAQFPRALYRRWMGWKAEDSLGKFGGLEWEMTEDGPDGRMCLPPMLLHPVKRRDLGND